VFEILFFKNSFFFPIISSLSGNGLKYPNEGEWGDIGSSYKIKFYVKLIKEKFIEF